MNKNLLMIFVFLLILILIFIFLKYKTDIFDFNKEKILKVIKINNIEIEVEVADTVEKRIKGLSKRESVEEKKGMLFVFKKPGYYPIWMRKMNFPLDIVWINENFEIIDINRDVSPETFPKHFRSSIPCQYVLELKSGATDKYNIKVGDKIYYK